MLQISSSINDLDLISGLHVVNQIWNIWLLTNWKEKSVEKGSDNKLKKKEKRFLKTNTPLSVGSYFCAIIERSVNLRVLREMRREAQANKTLETNASCFVIGIFRVLKFWVMRWFMELPSSKLWENRARNILLNVQRSKLSPYWTSNITMNDICLQFSYTMVLFCDLL